MPDSYQGVITKEVLGDVAEAVETLRSSVVNTAHVYALHLDSKEAARDYENINEAYILFINAMGIGERVSAYFRMGKRADPLPNKVYRKRTR